VAAAAGIPAWHACGVTGLVEVLERLPPAVVLVVAFLLVLGETGVIAGLLFPVEVTLLFVGSLAYLGELPLGPVLVLMFAAAAAGDALALRGGRRYGPRVRASRLGARIGQPRWERADRLLRRFGGRSAFVARWVPFVRTILPRLAGSAGLRYRQFAPWNVAGVVTAVGFPVVSGYLAGASIERMAEISGRATAAVVAAVVLAVVAAAVAVPAGRWLWRRRPARGPAGG
jgi:undecaprenyl-diphosphatase